MNNLEQKYRFLAKSSHQLLSKDAANVSVANTTLLNAVIEDKRPLISVMELNNRLI